jgi:ligand-binding sensor domain-containing protein
MTTPRLTYTKDNSGLTRNDVYAIAIDSDDNKWFAIGNPSLTRYQEPDPYGVIMFDGRTWTAFTPANSGLVSAYVLSIAVDPLGNIWFGTTGGVSKLSRE